MTLDGHVFFDSEEGYSFDYSVYEVDGTTIRSGLTSVTVDQTLSSGDWSFVLSGEPALNMSFRQLFPYQECGFSDLSGYNPNLKCGSLYECGPFTKSDGSALPDPIHADLSSYPAGHYYYDHFLGAGLGSLDPLSRALIDDISLSANFTYSVNTFLSSNEAASYTGGLFTDVISICDSDNELLYIDVVEDSSKTVLSNLSGTNGYMGLTEYAHLTGSTFVKPVGRTDSLKLSAALSATIGKYNAYVQEQVNDSLVDFDVVYDTIILKGRNAMLIDKINFDEDGYQQPTTKNTFYVTNSADNFNKVSNRFFREDNNTITFVIMNEYPVLSGSNNKIIYPNIYRYNIASNKTKRLWPINTDTDVRALSGHYSVPNPQTVGGAISANIVAISEPKLAYNTKNSVWKLTFVGKDLNSFPHIFDYTLKERNTFVETVSSRVYTIAEKESQTTNWIAPSASYITFGVYDNVTVSDCGIVPS